MQDRSPRSETSGHSRSGKGDGATRKSERQSEGGAGKLKRLVKRHSLTLNFPLMLEPKRVHNAEDVELGLNTNREVLWSDESVGENSRDDILDMSDAFPEISKWTLSFQDTELEEAFKLHISGLTRGKVRRALLILTLFNLLLGIMEPFLGYSQDALIPVGVARAVAVVLGAVLFGLCLLLSEQAFYTGINKRLPLIYFFFSVALIGMSLFTVLFWKNLKECPHYSFFSGEWSLPTELLYTVVLFSSGMRISWACWVFNVHLILGLVLPIILMKLADVSDLQSCFYNWSICFVPLLGILCAVQGFTLELQIRKDFITRCNIYRDRKRRNEIIESMLPRDIADKLMEGQRPQNLLRRHDSVTILFIYVANFKDLSLKFGAADIVRFLHLLYTQFDHATDHQNVYKVEAIAESYICMTGIMRGLTKKKNSRSTPPDKEPDKALKMAELLMAIASKVKTPDNKQVELKIGIHTGKVVAGITGFKSYSYHMFGDTINTASRMASTCKTGAVQISAATYQAVSTDFKLVCKQNAPVLCKGKGEMQTYSPDFDPEAAAHLLDSFIKFLKIKNSYNPLFTEVSAGNGSHKSLPVSLAASGKEKTMMEKIRVKGLKFVFKKKDGSYCSIGSVEHRRSSLEGLLPRMGSSTHRWGTQSLFRTPTANHMESQTASRTPSGLGRSPKSLAMGSVNRMGSHATFRTPRGLGRTPRSFLDPPRPSKTPRVMAHSSMSMTSCQLRNLNTGRKPSLKQRCSTDTQASCRLLAVDESRPKASARSSNKEPWERVRTKTSSVALASLAFKAQTSRDFEPYQPPAPLVPETFTNIEQDFCQSHNQASVPAIRRFFYIVAAILLAVLYLFDIMLQHEMTMIVKARITIRIATLGMLMLLIYASHKWKAWFTYNLQLICSVAAVVFCLHANQELLWKSTSAHSNISVNIIIIIAISTLMGLRYHYTNAANFCCIIIYGMEIFCATDQLKLNSVGFLTFQIFSAYVGSYECLKLEIEQRYNYLHKAILEHDNLLSEKLLKNMFPGSHHIHALIKDIPVLDDLDRVTILFSDFKGYTAWCNKQEDPETVYKVLNKIYNAFDKHLDEQGVYKLETIGDAFVVVGGLKGFKSRENHALAIIKFAFCILYELEMITKQLNLDFVMRIGVHTGPAVGGVVGIKKPRYLCWGKSSLIANLLESCGTPGRILVSRETLLELTSHQLAINGLQREENHAEVKLGDEVIQSFFINGEARRFVTVSLDTALQVMTRENSSIQDRQSRWGLLSSEKNLLTGIEKGLRKVGNSFIANRRGSMPSLRNLRNSLSRSSPTLRNIPTLDDTLRKDSTTPTTSTSPKPEGARRKSLTFHNFFKRRSRNSQESVGSNDGFNRLKTTESNDGYILGKGRGSSVVVPVNDKGTIQAYTHPITANRRQSYSFDVDAAVPGSYDSYDDPSLGYSFQASPEKQGSFYSASGDNRLKSHQEEEEDLYELEDAQAMSKTIKVLINPARNPVAKRVTTGYNEDSDCEKRDSLSYQFSLGQTSEGSRGFEDADHKEAPAHEASARLSLDERIEKYKKNPKSEMLTRGPILPGSVQSTGDVEPLTMVEALGRTGNGEIHRISQLPRAEGDTPVSSAKRIFCPETTNSNLVKLASRSDCFSDECVKNIPSLDTH